MRIRPIGFDRIYLPGAIVLLVAGLISDLPAGGLGGVELEVAEKYPVCLETPEFSPPQMAIEGNPVKIISLLGIRFYQRHITDLITTHCPSHPSCSEFGKQSIENYGLWGFFMTIDRLFFRENSSMQHYYKVVKVKKGPRFYDPPSNNYIFNKEEWKIQ